MNPIKVDSSAVESATIKLFVAAGNNSALKNAFSYQCVVKPPKGIVGKQSELKENTKLAIIGAKTKRKRIAI
mgnify:CR=1 FL=1